MPGTGVFGGEGPRDTPGGSPAGRPRGKLRRRGVLLAGATALLVPVGALQAQFTLLEGEKSSLDLGGYFRSLTGLYDQGFRIPNEDRRSGFNAEVLRLKWTLRMGEGAVVEVHDRFQLQASSSSSTLGGSAAGFGVTVVPGRSLDLSTHFIDEDRLRAWHDVDRLSLTLYTGLGDVTVGRQAITWGISNLFPVADLWAQFSPFELDTEEKPGIDAVRILSYPTGGLELDAIAADRGTAEDFSAGLRASLSLPWADLYFAGGKLWNEAMVLGGVAAPVGSWKLRAEGVELFPGETLPWGGGHLDPGKRPVEPILLRHGQPPGPQRDPESGSHLRLRAGDAILRRRVPLVRDAAANRADTCHQHRVRVVRRPLLHQGVHLLLMTRGRSLQPGGGNPPLGSWRPLSRAGPPTRSPPGKRCH
jgi:hypothetical protein